MAGSTGAGPPWEGAFRRDCAAASRRDIAGSGDIRVDRVQGDTSKAPSPGPAGSTSTAIDVQSLKLAIAGSGGVKAGAGKAQSCRL